MTKSLLLLLFAAGCASPAPEPQAPASTPMTAAKPPPDAEPAPDSVCSGPALDLLAAIASPECRIDEAEADRLRQALGGPETVPLTLGATHVGGARVRVRIVNASMSTVTLPLFVHSEVDAFPTRAGPRPLAPPLPDWPSGFSYETGRMLAKVTLPSTGYADATIVIDARTAWTAPGDCPPNAKCPAQVRGGAPLAPGEYELSIGTPVYSSRGDLTARVPWRVPGPKPKPHCDTRKCKPGERSVPGCQGGMYRGPDACPPLNRCVPAGKPVPMCPRVP